MDIQLIKFTDGALAKRMISYLDRTESLIIRAEYYQGKECPEAELALLRKDYVRLKKSIRADAEYIAYTRRSKSGSPLYENKFAPSVSAAAAWGLYAPDDCVPDKELIKSLSDSKVKLISEYPYDYWCILAQDD